MKNAISFFSLQGHKASKDSCGGGSGSGGGNRRDYSVDRREDDSHRYRQRRKYDRRSVSSEDSDDSDDRSRSPDARRMTARERRREKRRNRQTYERRRGRRYYSDSDDAPLKRSRDREDGECGTTDSEDSVVFVPSDGATVSAECVPYEGDTTKEKKRSRVSFLFFLLINLYMHIIIDIK